MGGMRTMIIEEIERDGPIGFDRFMELALYAAGAGYFSTGELRSDRAGDFLTSPEVSPAFGETIAAFVTAEHERIGEPFTLAEVGGGSGSLIRPLVDALSFEPGLVVSVERSAAARRAMGEIAPDVVQADELPAMRGVVVANELLDNMPAAILRRGAAGWVEEAVGIVGDELGRVDRLPADELVEWAEEFGGEVPGGGRVEVQREAAEWVADTIGRIETGALVVFDYGDTAEGLRSRRAEGTVRTYRGHHLGPDPLLEPGATDVTMDVNFTAMVAAAEGAGAEVDLMRQDDFLRRWGLEDALERVKEEEQEAAREGRTDERLRLRSRRVDMETLLHPRGLGDFRVLVARVV